MESDRKRRKYVEEQVQIMDVLPMDIVAHMLSFLTLAELKYACSLNRRIRLLCENYRLMDRRRDFRRDFTLHYFRNHPRNSIPHARRLVRQDSFGHLILSTTDELTEIRDNGRPTIDATNVAFAYNSRIYVTTEGRLMVNRKEIPTNGLRVMHMDVYRNQLAFVTEDGKGYIISKIYYPNPIPTPVNISEKVLKIFLIDSETTAFITHKGQLLLSEEDFDIREPTVVAKLENVPISNVVRKQNGDGCYVITESGALWEESIYNETLELVDTDGLLVSQVALLPNALIIVTPSEDMYLKGAITQNKGFVNVFDSGGRFVLIASNVTHINAYTFSYKGDILAYVAATNADYPHGDKKYTKQINAECITCGLSELNFKCSECDAVFCGLPCGYTHFH